jgi:Protein of unknown function (DUF2949)
MHSTPESQLIEFLQQELSISAKEIDVVLRRQEPLTTHMPILLWQYGLITIQQLEKIFDWQEQVAFSGAEI